MMSLAYSLSYEGGSRNTHGASLPPVYRAGLGALFLGLIGLDFSGVIRYSDLLSVWGGVPIFGGLVRAFLVCGVAAAVLGERFALRVLLTLGAVGSTVGFLTLIASGHWTLSTVAGHAARIGFPLVAVLLVYRTVNRPEATVRVLVALTFFAHAFSGFGWPSPRPEVFDVLVTQTIGLEEGSLAIFFVVVGVLDLLAVAFLFSSRLAAAGVIYMAGWGLVTSLAYPWACLNLTGEEAGWMRWASEFLTRVPHFLLPLTLLFGAGSVRAHSQGGHRRLDISRL